MQLTKTININARNTNSIIHALLLGIFIALFSGYSHAVEMEEVHALIKAAKIEMREINETDDKDKRNHLLMAHQETMQRLYTEFKELQEEGKLTGNSTLMADIMLYQYKMLEAMMHEIERP